MKPTILICTPETAYFQKIAHTLSFFGQDSFVHLKTPDELLASENLGAPAACLIDARGADLTTLEWTQSVRMAFEKAVIIVLHQADTVPDVDVLKKNGANYLMHAHFDAEFIVDLLLEETHWDFGSDVPLTALQSIEAQDLPGGVALEFPVFVHLPHNGKTIQLRRKGDQLSEQIHEKASHLGQSVYFKKTDRGAVLTHLEKMQKPAEGAAGFSGTVGAIRAKRIFFESMAEFFDASSSYQSGKNIFENTRKIVGDLGLLGERPVSWWRDLILKRAGHERSFYDEALSLAHFAAAFGHLAKLSAADIEALALAGLLHNIGLSKVGGYVLGQDPSALSDEQQRLYRSYPAASSAMIKNKKVALPAAVNDIILQHRERPDGTGFPSGLTKDKFHPLTPMFHIAYRFQELTSIDGSGREKRTVIGALELMKEGALNGKEPLELGKVALLLKSLKD